MTLLGSNSVSSFSAGETTSFSRDEPHPNHNFEWVSQWMPIRFEPIRGGFQGC